MKIYSILVDREEIDTGIIGGKYFQNKLFRMKYVHIGPNVEFN